MCIHVEVSWWLKTERDSVSTSPHGRTSRNIISPLKNDGNRLSQGHFNSSGCANDYARTAAGCRHCSNKNASYPYSRTEMYAGHVACRPPISDGEHTDGTH